MYLLDSKLYRWGQYEWIASGDKELIIRSDGDGRHKANWMHAAAVGYRSLLGPEVEVILIVMIHERSTSLDLAMFRPTGCTRLPPGTQWKGSATRSRDRWVSGRTIPPYGPLFSAI